MQETLGRVRVLGLYVMAAYPGAIPSTEEKWHVALAFQTGRARAAATTLTFRGTVGVCVAAEETAAQQS